MRATMSISLFLFERRKGIIGALFALGQRIKMMRNAIAHGRFTAMANEILQYDMQQK